MTPDSTVIPSQAPDDEDLSARIAHYDEFDAPMRALLALDAGQMGSWFWDMVAGVFVGDARIATLFGLDYASQPWSQDVMFASIHPADLPAVLAAVESSNATGQIFQSEFRAGPADNTGEQRWLGGRGNVIERDADGTPLKMIGINWDATQQKAQEERLALLASEMDHRVKNAFAVIRALVNLGLRTSDSKTDFGHALIGQVEAMANAHAVSVRLARQTEGNDALVDMLEILKAALSPWLNGSEDLPGSIHITADATHLIRPDQSSAFSMVVYELATNATKYGVLGERGGILNITISTHADGDIVFDWQEACAHPPCAGQPTQADPNGFGTTLIAHCAAKLGQMTKNHVTDQGMHLTLQINRDRGGIG